MNIQRAKIFLKVVDHGTLTAAARSLHMAQPSLSRQLKVFQTEVGFKLLEPRGQRLVVTPAGEAFIPIARELVRQQQHANQATALLKWGCVRSLSCSSTSYLVHKFISHYVTEAGKQVPMIRSRAADPFELEHELLTGVDFIVTPVQPSEGVEQVKLGSLPLGVHVAQDHEWQGRESICVAELEGRTIIAQPQETVGRQALDDLLTHYGVSPGEIVECHESSNIQALAAAGFGIGVTPEPGDFGTWRSKLADPECPEHQLPGVWIAWLPGHYAESWLWTIADGMHQAFAELSA